MRTEKSFLIRKYDFSSTLGEKFQDNHYARDLWPLVYILSDGAQKEAYVGETTDVISRMGAHLNTPAKKKLTAVHLITSETFNKSATLDIEANLIKYLSGDGQYRLLNANLGLANHNYYQKNEIYWNLFKDIWNGLRSEGITRYSIDTINNSDLFKYSPYKALTTEQHQGLLEILRCMNSEKIDRTIVEGGAGTGKTILAVFLFKMLASDLVDFSFREFGDSQSEFLELITKIKAKFPTPKMALVVPMSSFRKTLQKVFSNIKGLKASMVIGPAEVSKTRYDLLVIDESHRLRRRVNLGTYFGAFDKVCDSLGLDKNTASELDWILKQSSKSVLFYDSGQSIKPSDALKADFDRLLRNPKTARRTLLSQFRVKGGNAYVKFLNHLLSVAKEGPSKPFSSLDYEFMLFDNLEDMVKTIHLRDREVGLSRLIAGYSWEWVSKKDSKAYDIEIENCQLRWNSTSQDWINTPNAVAEVGCIHTTQGYDLNYSGIIFGHEIDFDPVAGEIIILAENYKDRNGKLSISHPEDLKNYILNIYKTILLRAIKGTYVYVCNPNLRAYFDKHILKFTRDAREGIEVMEPDRVRPFENAIPLYPLNVAAGDFGMLQEVHDVDWIALPEDLKDIKDLFACRVVGESMNKVIPNGSICLFRKHKGGSRHGEIVLVEMSTWKDVDFGSCYTIKEYHSEKSVSDDGWKHNQIILKPQSTIEDYKDLILSEDDQIEFRVLGEFDRVLGQLP